MRKVMVIGGGGYVGSVLCPTLVAQGYTTIAVDTFWYDRDVLPNEVWKVQCDMRDVSSLKRYLIGCDAVIHLACISNDPSFDLNPDLGESINWKSFPFICKAVKEAGIKRFIYASSSSVYGIKEDGECTEDVACNPLTDYSKFKLKCEQHLRTADMGDTVWTIIRPATVCGYSPRLRLDLVVNAISISALWQNKITVHGGPQLRPNVHIKDMARAYVSLLRADQGLVHGQTFNAGSWNASLLDIAQCVSDAIGNPDLKRVIEPTNDLRSYHINSDKIKNVLGFEFQYEINQAVKELAIRWTNGDIENPPTSSKYYNIKRMKEVFK